jgi:hypothetical protein
MADKKIINLSDKSVDLASPAGLIEFATTLKTFVVQQKLYTPIQNKNYVNVEGWQFAAAATGIMPIVKSVERIETKDATEIKYRAEVRLKRLSDGSTIGFGVAICSNKEAKRKTADEYVIASMAQTRAVGKSLRNNFGWLMKMAGYEATPSEEMDSVGSTRTASSNVGVDLDQLKAKVNKAKTTDELKAVQDQLPPDVKIDTVQIFVDRLGEIQGNGTA